MATPSGKIVTGSRFAWLGCALAGGLTGGITAMLAFGLLGLVLAFLTHMAFFDSLTLAGIAGALLGAIGGGVAGWSRGHRLTFRAALVVAFLAIISLGGLRWASPDDLIIPLGSALLGLFEGIAIARWLAPPAGPVS